MTTDAEEITTPRYTGSLLEMFATLYRAAKRKVEPHLWAKGREDAVWIEYHGPDCKPFKAYIRCRKDCIVLATVFGLAPDGDVIRKGRMPKILHAMSRANRRVLIESVVARDFVVYLEGIGFQQDSARMGNYYKVYE